MFMKEGDNCPELILNYMKSEEVITNFTYEEQESRSCLSFVLRDKDSIEFTDLHQSLSAKTFLGKIILSVSLKEFSRRKMKAFTPSVFLKDGDDLTEYGITAKVIGLSGHTKGSIGIDVDGKELIVGDALMNMFYPTVSMLYNDEKTMLDSAKKITGLGERIIYFGHGKPVQNKTWVKKRNIKIECGRRILH